MKSTSASGAASAADPATVRARARELGSELARAFRTLVDAIPGSPRAPVSLARQLGLSRVTIGRLLIAIAKPNAFEVLEQAPGPESLRVIARAAAGLGVDARLVDDAIRVADRFAELIRHDFGTRGAFNAAISAQRPELKRRIEHASRYQVHMGMRQILGVAADTWLTCMLFAPSRADPDWLSVTAIHGALGMRRLRPDVGVYFTAGPPPQLATRPADVARVAIDLREFCAHEPAPLETHEAGGQLVYRLAHDRLGRRATVDMLGVDHNPRGSPRYATPQRPRGGLVVFPDVPVKTLICDALLHDDVFPGATPELIVYNPGARGPANPADRRRDIDRIDVPEQIQDLGKRPERFVVPEVPRYEEMLTRVCTETAQSLASFRTFRLRMAYPVHGFQIVMAFEAPPKPE